METKKDILLSIHNIDALAYKFNNKFKFMNLQLLINLIDHITEDQLSDCANKVAQVEKIAAKLGPILDELDSASLELIESYDRTKYSDS